jgi:hypothetical protein
VRAQVRPIPLHAVFERMPVTEYGMRMPSCPRLGFEQRDVALRVVAVCRVEPGHDGAGAPHLRRNPARLPQLLPTE